MMTGMLIRHRGTAPRVDPTAFVPPTATLVGDVASAAFGVDADWEDRIARYERTAEVRVAEYAAHLDDEIVG